MSSLNESFFALGSGGDSGVASDRIGATATDGGGFCHDTRQREPTAMKPTPNANAALATWVFIVPHLPHCEGKSSRAVTRAKRLGIRKDAATLHGRTGAGGGGRCA